MGLVLGMSLNFFTINTIKKLQSKRIKFNIISKIMLQLIFSAILVAYIKIYISSTIISNLQQTIPGLFFASCFFGAQYTLFDDAKIYINAIDI